MAADRPTRRTRHADINTLNDQLALKRTPGKPLLTPLEQAIGLLGMLKWCIQQERGIGSRNAANPLPQIEAVYGRRFARFADALPHMERRVEAEKEKVRERARRHVAEPLKS